MWGLKYKKSEDQSAPGPCDAVFSGKSNDESDDSCGDDAEDLGRAVRQSSDHLSDESGEKSDPGTADECREERTACVKEERDSKVLSDHGPCIVDSNTCRNQSGKIGGFNLWELDLFEFHSANLQK